MQNSTLLLYKIQPYLFRLLQLYGASYFPKPYEASNTRQWWQWIYTEWNWSCKYAIIYYLFFLKSSLIIICSITIILVCFVSINNWCTHNCIQFWVSISSYLKILDVFHLALIKFGISIKFWSRKMLKIYFTFKCKVMSVLALTSEWQHIFGLNTVASNHCPFFTSKTYVNY